MLFLETSISGVWHIKQEGLNDERGYFARTYCANEFLKHAINFQIKQSNISFNYHLGTLRGMHFQQIPKQEPKLVRCCAGRIFDVAIDLRVSSKTYCQWFGIELDAKKGDALFIPEGCAHGFLTLTDNCEILYQMGEVYAPDFARGVRWNDPVFNIEWPITPVIISSRDTYWDDFIP